MSSKLVFLAILGTLVISSLGDTLPVIGILSIPSEYDEYPANLFSYSPSSYAKNFEAGGAQVIPLQYDMKRERLTYLLERVNGVVFHGGDTEMIDEHGNLTPLGETMDFVVKYVLEQNKNGNYFPLWGTCMGFQGIACLIQGNWSILTNDCLGCSGVNHNNYFDESYQSRLYADLPQDLRDAMPTSNISVFSHFWDFHWDTFQNSAPLNTILKPVTYALDNKGLKYVSSYESPSIPIYATQFHQEKSTYEWNSGYEINHGSKAVRLQQYLADFFVDECRKNTNLFPNVQEYLIDNYQLTVLKKSAFSSIYFFPSMKSDFEEEEKKKEHLFLRQQQV